MRTIRQLTTILPVALMLTGIGAAQSTPPAVNGSQANIPTGQQAASTQDSSAHTAPIFWISSVEVFP